MRKHLYRFISFEDFINLVINNKDRFVRPSIWDDGYEGYLFSSLDSPEDVRHIVSEMFNNLCPRNYYAIPDNYFRMWHSKWFTYAQCWSEHPETDAMWRCYSYGNKALRIRTREDKLLAHAKSIFQENEDFAVYLKKVSYDLNKKSNVEQQIAQMGDSKLTHETYFHKLRSICSIIKLNLTGRMISFSAIQAHNDRSDGCGHYDYKPILSFFSFPVQIL